MAETAPWLVPNKEIEEHPAEILRVTAYHRKDLDPTVIFADQHPCIRALSTIYQAFGSFARSRLGHLSRLPLEILHEIFHYLDLSSALRFSHVNRNARQAIGSMKEYRHVRVYAKSTLYGLFESNLASRTYIDSVHAALCNRNARCIGCGRFSSLLFLPFMQRCCSICLNNSPSLRIMSLDGFPTPEDERPVRELFEKLQLPILRSIIWHKEGARPKMPVEDRSFNPAAVEIVSELHARAVIRRIGSAHFRSPSQSICSWKTDKRSYDIALKLPITDAEIFDVYFDSDVERLISNMLRAPMFNYSSIQNYRALTFLPYLDPPTESIKFGYSCKGCDRVDRKSPCCFTWPHGSPEPVYSRA